jgi:glutamate carboxypeptidase
MSVATNELIGSGAAEIAQRAQRELEALVAVSSPSGDVEGAEAALAICAAWLPDGAQVERPPCSTPGSAPDLLARIPGRGRRRVMLLGHVDTVIGHAEHQPLRREGERLYGTGTADMKGGDVLAFGVARALAAHPESFAELAVLMVTDEEWRTAEFVHAERLAGYDACLCFEAGERTAQGDDALVVRRKAAGTLRITATGRASHSGSAPDRGRNALLALAQTAGAVAALHDPGGPDALSVVPTVMRSGQAFNVVPASGELIFDLRAATVDALQPVLGAVAHEIDGVTLDARMERRWPAMDTDKIVAPLLARASAALGRPLVGVPRGGASDAAHFAATIPLTVDGLGPRGGGAHTPEEFVLSESLRSRAEVALAVALAALADG